MSRVYYRKTDESFTEEELSAAARQLLEAVVEREAVALEKRIALKVHFGEEGNATYVKPACFNGIIDLLVERGTEAAFMDTSVLYAGPRRRRESHTRLALAHGFTRLPVVIADGEAGEHFDEVPINGRHFKSCKIGAEYRKYAQMIVIAHFKGHRLAGFGGAVKQLSMGCAAKGGKLAMHMGIKPYIISFLCKRCGLCAANCPAQAISAGGSVAVDGEKCIGCGACFALCPNRAVSIYTPKSVCFALLRRGDFYERLAEYAYAAQRGRRNVYINFAVNITANCDCVSKKMTPVMHDIGIFAGADAVAVDSACCAAAQAAGHRFKGTEQLRYAEKLGLGSTSYELVGV
ncbi:MAG: DUF362 domain-containing protein [Synergistes jonesii]|uniref:DUF362 domain-containing protein n=1 Tax=Synergistes jonesii TaxID=2754 RepID=UPI002A754B23|nr:DUF362 domain-containing protein [Synergistes jonesii]MDY2985369.1 DUF362 domain-containing protein [Synergistes jonesii]